MTTSPSTLPLIPKAVATLEEQNELLRIKLRDTARELAECKKPEPEYRLCWVLMCKKAGGGGHLDLHRTDQSFYLSSDAADAARLAKGDSARYYEVIALKVVLA